MKVLSFDTSDHLVQVSLFDQGKLCAESSTEGVAANRKDVGSLLMPEIDALVKKAGFKKNELELIVVGTGPGSFTGIRVAAITARTLAQSLAIPLVGVNSLEARAQILDLSQPAATILAASPGHYFYAAYKTSPERPADAVVEPRFDALLEMQSRLAHVKNWFADEKSLAELKDALPSGMTPALKPLVRPANLATAQSQLALSRLFLNGSCTKDQLPQDFAESFAWFKVVPLYLRSPSVTLKKPHGNTDQAHGDR